MQKTINLEGLKDSESLEICFSHGYCHYLALGMADEYNTKVALWLDYDDYLQKEVLIHAFTVIGDSLYFDADGVFKDLSERIDEFEYNYDPNIIIVSKEEAKKIFQKMKIPYGETTVKRFIREKLRSHSIVFEVQLKGEDFTRLFAYKFEGGVAGINKVMVTQVNHDGKVGEFISSFTENEFRNILRRYMGVISNKGVNKL